MSWTGLHKFADAIFGITQKPPYIISSNFFRWHITKNAFFWTCFATWRVTGHYFQAQLFLITLSIKWDLSIKRDWLRKKKLSFLRLLIIFFQNIFKRISYMQWVFWVICQNWKGVWASFWCTFSACILHKNVP